MKLIEAGLLKPKEDQGNLEAKLSFLQRIGVHDLILPDFLALRDLSHQIRGLDSPIGHLNVVSHPNRESIKIIWEILKSYDSFTVFIRCNRFDRDEEYKEALYQAFSYTDEVGCMIEDETIMTMPINELIKTLQEEFEVRQFLIQENEGSFLPDEISKCIEKLRSSVLDGSEILHFPNNRYGLGMINALTSIRLEVDGLVGSAIRCMDPKIVNLEKLHFLYHLRRKELFSEHSRNSLDHAFEHFITNGDEA